MKYSNQIKASFCKAFNNSIYTQKFSLRVFKPELKRDDEKRKHFSVLISVWGHYNERDLRRSWLNIFSWNLSVCIFSIGTKTETLIKDTSHTCPEISFMFTVYEAINLLHWAKPISETTIESRFTSLALKCIYKRTGEICQALYKQTVHFKMALKVWLRSTC